MVSEVLIFLPPHPAAFFLFCFFGGLKCSLCPKNRDFRNLSFLGLPPGRLASKIGIFEIWVELAWLLLRKLFFLLRSSLQLPRLRLGPLKGFLS